MKPYVVVEWNDTESDAQGWLCIYNLVKGYAGGGTRMHPSVTREMVIHLAEVMAYKRNAAENSRKGGMKAGIRYDYKAPDALAVFRRFIMAIRPYIEAGLNLGSDLGTREEDMRAIFDELGIEEPMTPEMKRDPVIAKGTENLHAMLKAEYRPGHLVDNVVTGYGVAFSADEAWKALRGAPGASVVVQGFGNVGMSFCQKISDLGYKVVGVADVNCFVYCKDGLDVENLITNALPRGEMDKSKFDPSWKVMGNHEWITAPCDIFVPAAIADVVNGSNVRQFQGKLICEGANIAVTPEADTYLHAHGVHVVPDFVANLGAIRFFYGITFGEVAATPQAIIDDIEQLTRKNAKNLFASSLENGRYEREIAMELFRPTVQDPPQCC